MKSIIKQFIFKTRLYKLNYIRNQFYIIPYHMISGEPNGFYPETSTRDFERQIAYLARNYNVISLDAVVERIKTGRSLRRNIVITFDDGFRNNYTNAYPILRECNLPATIFLTTGSIENGTAPWFIKLRYIFMNTEETHLTLSVSGRGISWPMRTPLERFKASDKAMAHLKNCPDNERLPLLDALCEQLGVNNFEGLEGLMLTWNQITEMSKNGIYFGAHTVSHPILSRIPISRAEKEIFDSKEAIEDKIAKPARTFAYPFGKKGQYGTQIFQILQRMQFKCAVTTEPGVNTPVVNLFELKRSSPWELSTV